MPISRLLIANRGEIAIRVARAAADMGLRSVAVHSSDDAGSLHVRAADEVRELPGQGVAAYLDADAVIAAAKASGCDAVHPGYDSGTRRQEFDRRTAVAYEDAKAVNAVTGGGIDDVIDPADTRKWIVNSLKRLPPVLPRTEKKYPYIDPW
jgi:acetyl-CoA carboxylase carboxyltransferase component